MAREREGGRSCVSKTAAMLLILCLVSSMPVVTSFAPKVPGAVNDLTAEYGAGSVVLTWSAPSDGGSTITGYQVNRSTSGGTVGPAIAVVQAHHYLDSNVTAPHIYYYRIKAVNSVGAGPEGNTANVTIPTSPVPPAAPANLTAQAGVGFVSLHWDPPLLNGSGPVTGYRVYRANATGPWPADELITVPNGYQYLIDRNVPTGSYRYKVAAINYVDGPGSYEADVYVEGIPAGAPGTIFTISLVEKDTHLDLSWSAPPPGASGIVGYRIFRSATPYDPILLANTTDTNFLDDHVESGTTYYYWFVATNGQGDGPLSGAVSGSIHPGQNAIPVVWVMALVLVLAALVALFAFRSRLRGKGS